MQHTKTLFTTIVMALTAQTAQAESTLLMSMSFDSLDGKFGRTQETKVDVVNTGITLVEDGFRASVYIPYVRLEGPGTVVGGTVTGNSAQTQKASGLGDVLSTLSFDMVGAAHENGLFLGATGLIKFATGDEDEGLSTGATDYGVQLDVGYRFNSSFALTGNVGRSYYGESDVVTLEDGGYYSVGAQLGLSDSFTMVFSTAKRDPLQKGDPDRKENTVTAVYGVTPTTAFQVTAIRGRTDSSPDSVISVGLIFQP